MADIAAGPDTLSGLRYRPSVRELEKDPDKFKRFVDAWKAVLAKPRGDESSFQHIAGIHGEPAPHDCLHNVYFFPWHRAYLLKLERALNKIDPTVALPWWDFTTDLSRKEGLPPSFRSVADGGVDVLASSPIEEDGNRHTTRNLNKLSELPAASVVDTAMTQRNYVSFYSNYYSPVHNKLHGWIRGDASTTAYTAYDPSFWIIHCAIDRHWWLWQLDHPGSTPPNLDRVMRGLDVVARDVLDINKLGYEYATTEIAVEF